MTARNKVWREKPKLCCQSAEYIPARAKKPLRGLLYAITARVLHVCDLHIFMASYVFSAEGVFATGDLKHLIAASERWFMNTVPQTPEILPGVSEIKPHGKLAEKR